MLVDTHAHIYSDAFDNDKKAVIERAMAAGIAKIVMPNIDAAAEAAMMQMQEQFPEVCFPAMGLHPCSVKEEYGKELDRMESLLHNGNFVAVGETGLDYYWDTTFVKEQQQAFERQLSWSKALGLPIIIHSRDSIDDCIAMFEAAQDGRLTGVFHCFSGNREQLERIVHAGGMIGIGGVATFKNGGLDKVLQASDLPRIVLETDAPYLAPVPHRGKRNEPAFIPLVVQRLFQLLETDAAFIEDATTANARQLFPKIFEQPAT